MTVTVTVTVTATATATVTVTATVSSKCDICPLGARLSGCIRKTHIYDQVLSVVLLFMHAQTRNRHTQFGGICTQHLFPIATESKYDEIHAAAHALLQATMCQCVHTSFMSRALQKSSLHSALNANMLARSSAPVASKC
jgi:hypothetical protein